MTEDEALQIASDFFASLEACGNIVTELEVTPDIYKAIKNSEQVKNGRLWSAKLIVSERPSLHTCYVKKVLDPSKRD